MTDAIAGTTALDLVTIGEPLVQLSADEPGPLRAARHFTLSAAGAELNTAIVAARLGLRTGYVARVGADDPGQVVLAELRANGVDTSAVTVDPERPTGLFLVQRGYPRPDASSSVYYRTGSAGAGLDPADVPAGYLAAARAVHFTGISLAVSDGLRTACLDAAGRLAGSGTLVSFDVNLRRKLCTVDVARKHADAALVHADVVFCGRADAAALFDTEDAESAAAYLASYGARLVAVTDGAGGAVLRTDEATVRVAAPPVAVADPTGAGDGFAAAVLTGLLQQRAVADIAERASLVGALVCTVRGDHAGAPTAAELDTLQQGAWVSR